MEGGHRWEGYAGLAQRGPRHISGAWHEAPAREETAEEVLAADALSSAELREAHLDFLLQLCDVRRRRLVSPLQKPKSLANELARRLVLARAQAAFDEAG